MDMYLIITDSYDVYWTEKINDELLGGVEDGFCNVINVKAKTYYTGDKWEKAEEIKDIAEFLGG